MLPKPLYTVKLVLGPNGSHNYTIGPDPTYYPGVTTALGCVSKYALLPWTARETSAYIIQKIKRIQDGRISSGKTHTPFENRFLDTLGRRARKAAPFLKTSAAHKGTHLHSLYDKVVTGTGSFTESELVLPGVQSFLWWASQEKLKIVAGDMKVASLAHQYGGGLDALAVDENQQLVIIDFKTGRDIYDTHAAQIAAYSYAVKEQFGLDYYPAGVCIKFDKSKPKYQRKVVRDIHSSFRYFRAALDLLTIQALSHFEKSEIKKQPKLKPKEKTTP